MSRQTIQATVVSRQERAASRILDDESLRGDLADDEFQPLLDWALAETDRIAASTRGMSDAEADTQIDKALDAIRDVVRAAGAAVFAHAEGDAPRRTSELAFIGTRWPRGGKLKALARRLEKDPELSGAEVATRIVKALGRSAQKPASGSQREKAP